MSAEMSILCNQSNLGVGIAATFNTGNLIYEIETIERQNQK